MSFLWVTEYSALGDDLDGSVMPVAREPAVTDQKVTFTSSTQSAAFAADTRFVRLQADANCHLAFGLNPTATTSTQPLIANTVEWRTVKGGHKVAVIDA